MEFMTAIQAAKLWSISQRRVRVLCSERRILGAFKIGDTWAIPANSSKPCDSRLKHMKKEHPENECN
jgi:hypothetical protein